MVKKKKADQEEPTPIGGGEVDTKCGARTRKFPFAPCEQPKGFGTNHAGVGACRFHGGLLPNHQVAAHRVQLDNQARIELKKLDLVPIENPLEQLQMLAAEVVAWKDIVARKVEELDSWTTSSIMEAEEIRAVISAYERALDRANTVLSGMVRLNLEERQQKLSAAWGLVMVELLEAVFGAKELSMTREQLATSKAIVARELPRFAASVA